MKDVIITIVSVQRLNGVSDRTELVTEGRYDRTKDGCVFVYNETEATGYQGSVTTVSVAAGKRLEIIRSGSVNSELYIETERRNYCHYGTPYGSLTVGAIAKKITARLNPNGGHIVEQYSLEANAKDMGEYLMDIVIRAR